MKLINSANVVRVIFILFVVAFVSLNSFGQINKPQEKKSEWYIRISPHFWFINLKGEIERPPVPLVPTQPIESEPNKEIEVSFGELKGSIKFAFMGSGQYIQNRFLTRFNITSLILEGDFITTFDLILQDVKGRLEYFAGDVGMGYDVLENPKLNVFLVGGFKYVYMYIGVEASAIGKMPIEEIRDRWFVDPVVGTYVRYRPLKWLELNGYGDIGFFSGDKITSQVIVEANFFITPWFYMAGGYRYWYLHVPKEEAIYNGRISGSVVKIGFQIH